MINKEIGRLTKIYQEVVNRYQYINKKQIELRKIVKTYTDCNDVPKDIRFEIFENKLSLNRYQKWMNDINKQLKDLGNWKIS